MEVSNKQTFDEYFKRLKIQRQKPSLKLVTEMQQKHIAELCFSSLTVLLKQAISLDINDIIKKMVFENRGGYCFEHNKLMHDALNSSGFKVRCLIAKVINNQDIDSPRTHRITLLEWDGVHYLVDVGFGPNSPRAPIQIVEGGKSKQNGLSYRLVINAQQDYQLELITEKGFFSLYTFNLNHYTEADCMMGNFYSSQHPNAVFVNNMVVSLIFPELTLSLRNNKYHRIGVDQTEIIHIHDHFQLQTIIKNDFKIQLSEAESELLYQRTCTDETM